MGGIVAIVGRPNVGKSTLFNRLIGERRAIVEDVPGVTRDRLYGEAEWFSRRFWVVDTGGLDLEAQEEIPAAIRRQVLAAVDEADLVLFVVSAQEGITPADESIAQLLRKSGKPVLLVVNKVDAPVHELYVPEFYRLGLSDPIAVSAAHGKGIAELVEAVLARLPQEDEGEVVGDDAIRVAIVGRPNVGKSSLVNAILGEERVVVTDVPGTTRDAVDIPFRTPEAEFVLVDTAGLRRPGRVGRGTEYYSTLRTLRALERAHVAVLVLDATEGIVEQDRRIAGYAWERGRAVVVAFNKWDAVERDPQLSVRYEREVRRDLYFLANPPVLYISALTGRKVSRLLEEVRAAAERFRFRIDPEELDAIFRDAVLLTPPPSVGGKRPRLYRMRQVLTGPPKFVVEVDDPSLVTSGYLGYLENRLREVHPLPGVPIRIEAERYVARRRTPSGSV
ncbi:ribosome biogenesis GTPase Der [Brockia lithotrophica]|uniref:GTPase Der n=1 Tax=Brockia lithotrophica TaxID=933949 RepID=A0A660L3D3_9BACL|nr:ribosome biogenesis GTPase Der [Brockia lithotrophica]RKQ88416.1 GTP-binding protein [Brockia lithotrophica]